MQDFAKKREVFATEYAKAKLSGENILFGNNPLQVTFDEWKKDPNALANFQAVGRDKLQALGMTYGKNYAEGNSQRDMSDLDLGIVGFVKGFKDSNSAWKAYQSDPKFRSLIDAQVSEIAKGRGLDPAHEEVRNTITSGIMSGVVGGIERHNLPAALLKGSGQTQNGELPGGPGFISADPIDQFPEPERGVWDLAKSNDALKTQVENKLKEISGGQFSTMSELDQELTRSKVDLSISDQATARSNVSSLSMGSPVMQNWIF